jgi:coenzyme F420-reducing hydrogenase delta subunit
LSNVVGEGRTEAATTQNVFERLHRRRRCNFDISKETKFIASHLSEIGGRELKGLDESIMSMILGSSELKIKNEDWLYELIWSLVEEDRSFFRRVRFVEFEFVSAATASRFIESVCEFVELIDSSLLSSIGRRFIQPFSPSTFSSRLALKEFVSRGKSLSGIISYLTSKHGGNVHDLGVIEVTSSSVGGYHPRNVVDLQNRVSSSTFYTKHIPNSWICYDMKDMEIALSHYSIISCQAGPNQASHPKSWRIEVSMDGSAWTEVHQCTNNSELNGSDLIGTFKVTQSIRCRLIRIRQTGKEHSNGDALHISGFEIFGILHER